MNLGFWWSYYWAEDLWSVVLHARARKDGYILAWRWCFMKWIGALKAHLTGHR